MPARSRRWVVSLAAVLGLVFLALAVARYATFHNRTFDLAFYARMAWGMAVGDLWDPVVGGHVLGLHLSPVLIPLGWLGRLFDPVLVLLVAQSAAVAAAAWPLARLGYRHLGTAGAPLAAVAFLLHPNLGHVATYEFHPGTLALLPMAAAVDAIDEGHRKRFVWATVGVLLCREDLALMTGALGLLWLRSPQRRTGLAVAAASALYVLFFAAVLHPAFAPAEGSMEAHFGKWGDSTAAVLWAWVSDPGAVLAHLVDPPHLSYLPRVLAPLALLPLLAPRWLLPVAPVFAINLMSDFPTTTDLDSHYLTPALPPLVAGAIVGAARVRGWVESARPAASRVASRSVMGLIVCATAAGAFAWGGLPGQRAFRLAAFTPDARSAASREVVERIPPSASVQAPDPLLAHLAERRRVHRSPPPERGTDFVVLDAAHRRRFDTDESVLRTTEEPLVRTWLARDDHAVVAAEGPWLLLERGRAPRSGVGRRVLAGKAPPSAGIPLCDCLAVQKAERASPDRVRFTLVARSPCPPDVALRFGRMPEPEHAGLIGGGLLSPAHFRSGDRILSEHPLALEDESVWLGAVRSSGARPEPSDPHAIRVPLGEPLPSSLDALPPDAIVRAPEGSASERPAGPRRP